MLSHTVIRGFNILCRTQFEHVPGRHNPLLGQTSEYSVMKNQKFVQILITTGVIGLLSAHLIAKTAKLFINVIFGPNNWFCKATNMRIDASRWNVLKTNVMRVQQQTNSVDCGILAMAFLILFDEDPMKNFCKKVYYIC